MNEASGEIWNQQILAHESWLRTVVRSRILCQDEADDVFQTIIAEALSFEDRREEIRALGPWLYRLAVNSVLQLRRRHGRQRKLTERFAAIGSHPTTQEPLQRILGIEQQGLVQQALQKMTGDDVEILMLKYVHGWNYQAICEQTGLEHSQVANRLRRARLQLKQHCLVQGLDGSDLSAQK